MKNEALHKLIQDKAAKRAGIRVAAAKALNPAQIERIPTGITGVDTILHGGIGRGDMTIVCGPTHTGKSTIASQIVAKAIAEDPYRTAVVYSGEKQQGEFKFDIFRQLAGTTMEKDRHKRGEYLLSTAIEQRIERAVYDQIVWLDTKDDEGKSLAQGLKWRHLREEMEAFADAGAEVFLIDNLMTLASDILGSYDLKLQSDLERQVYIGSWLEGFAKQYNVWVILVAHYRKATGYHSSGPDSILGSSSVPNSAGFILEYNRYTDDEISNDATLEYSRKIKIWKNRGFGTLALKGIRSEFDAASTRIWTLEKDKADKAYPWQDRFTLKDWHDYMADTQDILPS